MGKKMMAKAPKKNSVLKVDKKTQGKGAKEKECAKEEESTQ